MIDDCGENLEFLDFGWLWSMLTKKSTVDQSQQLVKVSIFVYFLYGIKCDGLEWCEMNWNGLKFVLQLVYFMTWMLDFEKNMT
jgi:hypothetical protein